MFLSKQQNVLRYQKLKQQVFECCFSTSTQAHNRFATHLLPCRYYIVGSQPKSAIQVCQVATVVMETKQLHGLEARSQLRIE